MSTFLVTPDRALHRVPDDKGLSAIARAHGLSSKAAGNLRQLLGWTAVGQGRQPRLEVANFQLLDNVKWLQRDGSDELVAVVGKLDHVWQTVVEQRVDMDFSKGSLQKLLSAEGRAVDSWRKVDPPPQLLARAAELPDGSSLDELFPPRQVRGHFLFFIAPLPSESPPPPKASMPPPLSPLSPPHPQASMPPPLSLL
jgi:hypothetical protein